jgi:uncharacterized protein (TIGR00266 family)
MENTIQASTAGQLDVKFQMRPGATAAEITLKPGQKLTAEGGAMIAKSTAIQMTTSTQQKKSGGIIKGLKRLVSGENFFLNHYIAPAEGGKLWLGATHIGDMEQKELHGENLIIQGGSFVACTENVSIDASWQGFKNLVSKESLFWVKASGHGTVIFNSFGAIYKLEVDGEHIVDTGHIVAFEETLGFTLTKAGKSWVSSVLGGEGLVCKFKGKGVVWVQSHNSSSFGSILGPQLKPR